VTENFEDLITHECPCKSKFLNGIGAMGSRVQPVESNPYVISESASTVEDMEKSIRDGLCSVFCIHENQLPKSKESLTNEIDEFLKNMLVPTLLKSKVKIPSPNLQIAKNNLPKKKVCSTIKWIKPNSSNLQALAPISGNIVDEKNSSKMHGNKFCQEKMSTGTKLKLLAFWKKNNHPSKEEISSLAMETHQLEHRIAIWFKNMRKRHKIEDSDSNYRSTSSLKIDSSDDSSDEIVISNSENRIITNETRGLPIKLEGYLKQRYAHSDCISDHDCHQVAAEYDVPVECISEWYRSQRKRDYEYFAPSKNMTASAKENACFLEAEYQKYQFLQREQALKLSDITLLSVTQINNWFQNRRAKKQRNKQRQMVKNSVDRLSSDEIIIEASPPKVIKPIISPQVCTASDSVPKMIPQTCPESIELPSANFTPTTDPSKLTKQELRQNILHIWFKDQKLITAYQKSVMANKLKVPINQVEAWVVAKEKIIENTKKKAQENVIVIEDEVVTPPLSATEEPAKTLSEISKAFQETETITFKVPVILDANRVTEKELKNNFCQGCYSSEFKFYLDTYSAHINENMKLMIFKSHKKVCKPDIQRDELLKCGFCGLDFLNFMKMIEHFKNKKCK